MLPALQLPGILFQGIQDFCQFCLGPPDFPLDTLHIALAEPKGLTHFFHLQIPFRSSSSSFRLCFALLLQLLLENRDLFLGMCLQFLACRQLPAYVFLVAVDLNHFLFDFFFFCLQGGGAFHFLLHTLPGLGNIQSGRILLYGFALDVIFNGLQVHTHPGTSRLGIFDAPVDFFRLGRQFCHMLLQGFNLPPPAQKIAAVFISAAADSAPGNQQFPFQRHDAQAVMVLCRQGHRVVHMVHCHNPAQQRQRHIPVFFVNAHQGVRSADNPLLPQHLCILKFLGIPDACQGQEGCPSQSVRL